MGANNSHGCSLASAGDVLPKLFTFSILLPDLIDPVEFRPGASKGKLVEMFHNSLTGP